MGDSRSTKKSSGEMENLALDANRFSRDLLQRFMGVSGGGGDGSERAEVGWREKEEAVEDDGELELNLGLSLGGRFGVDKSSNKLLRSSSIAACLPIVRDDDALATPAAAAYSALVRTSSLPVETEEEWRKRKELQTMRRLEAKRRRSEKQRISRGDGGSGAGSGVSNVDEPKREIGVNFRTRLDKEQLLAATKSSFKSGIDIGMFKGKRSCFSSNKMQPSSQGSIESQGANSSSMSELECKSLQGSCELSPGSIQSIQEGGNQETGSSRAKTTRDHPSRTVSGIETDPPPNKPESTSRQAAGTGSLEDMPCVFTKGDGPNGKRIDGILYKYGKGEEVRIMCVCHGSFLSPAEFVKHAGGSDVAHPLKHIVINRNSSPFQ